MTLSAWLKEDHFPALVVWLKKGYNSWAYDNKHLIGTLNYKYYIVNFYSSNRRCLAAYGVGTLKEVKSYVDREIRRAVYYDLCERDVSYAPNGLEAYFNIPPVALDKYSGRLYRVYIDNPMMQVVDYHEFMELLSHVKQD